MPLEIVRFGKYRARFASSEMDVLAAQSLRFECFNLSNKSELDVDEFDIRCRHVLIENLESEIDNIHTSLSVLTEALRDEKSKSERLVLYERYNDHHKRLLEVKEKLLELENVPDIQISALHK